LLGGLGGGVGEVEIGLEAEGVLDGLERSAKGGLSEPFSEDGGGGPEFPGRACGMGAEGS